MAGRPKRPLEERIGEKERAVAALQKRLKAEQSELEALYSEKKMRDLEGIKQLIEASGLDTEEVEAALHSYLNLKQQNAS